MHPKIIAIIGPTASGKSGLAIRLAKTLGGEIVSADSRQVYRELDIGSGKVSKREQRSVPHHLLNVADPKRHYTVAHFVQDGHRVLRDILQRGKLPIVVGGTGFWIDALLRGQSIPAVPPNPALRKRLARLSVQKLFAKLEKLDPKRATTIDRHNPARLIRALEILHVTGKPIPQRTSAPAYDVLWLGVRIGQQKLRQRIHRRLQQRLRAGMVAETQRLLRRGVPAKRLVAFGLEYRYCTWLLQKKISRAQFEKLLEHEIQRYAKRQITWFKRYADIRWVAGAGTARRAAQRYLQVNS